VIEALIGPTEMISIDDLMVSDEETMAVYQIILYLRFHPWYRINLFKHPTTTPSEILTVYFSTSSPEGLEKVKNTMVTFHRRFDQALALDSGQINHWDIGVSSEPSKRDRPIRLETRNEWLEELEARYFTRFKEAFEGYVKVDEIPTDYRVFVKKFLQFAHNSVIGVEFTSVGSAKIPYSQISVVAEKLREKEGEFIDILRESRIAYRGTTIEDIDSQSQVNIIIPSVAVALYEEL